MSNSFDQNRQVEMLLDRLKQQFEINSSEFGVHDGSDRDTPELLLTWVSSTRYVEVALHLKQKRIRAEIQERTNSGEYRQICKMVQRKKSFWQRLTVKRDKTYCLFRTLYQAVDGHWKDLKGQGQIAQIEQTFPDLIDQQLLGDPK